MQKQLKEWTENKTHIHIKTTLESSYYTTDAVILSWDNIGIVILNYDNLGHMKNGKVTIPWNNIMSISTDDVDNFEDCRSESDDETEEDIYNEEKDTRLDIESAFESTMGFSYEKLLIAPGLQASKLSNIKY
ncbi:MAG: hypothetical protein IKG42_03795 [Clostridia bacterium]|nr:hypothetical protein [Clostridia bacterium]